MVQFDEKDQKEKVAELYEQEEESLAQTLSQKYGVEYVDLTRVSIDTDALKLIDEPTARKVEIAPFRKIGKKVFIAMRAPGRADSLEAIQTIERLGYQTRLFMVSSASLTHAWDHYKDISHASASEGGVLNISSEEIERIKNELKSIEDVRKNVDASFASSKSHRVSRVLEVLLGGGLALHASDVHIEPEEEFIRVRFRLDGLLTEILEFDHETYKLLLSRIKLLSGLKLNAKSSAQDGRFSVKVGDGEMEIRTSMIPGNYGETVVMRLLDPSTIGLPLESLGMDDFLMQLFLDEIKKPNGMILNTGPTGSGKTTTLYAFLKAVSKPGIKVITLENPVEYHLPGIVQTQISKDYTFADGLRSILRQDPDIIMVGEIRDPEVAATAVHAALTGHLVFSTLHTNNAAGTFPRLIDIKVRPEILGSAVNLTMAQRLARRLCEDCKKSVPITGAARESMNKLLHNIPRPDELPENKDVMWEAVGCDTCNGTGYTGRLAILEAIRMDEAVEAAVRANPSEIEIWRAARPQQIRRMAEDGAVKVLQGVTSLDELARIIDIEDADLMAMKDFGQG
ncbi:type II/IV secretion system protein [Candidatus Kaiserbacteria bacterium]|nr:MAG: type II/IV secretion system protein [Candidatus Kaiserbacteria bacterium]